VVAVDLVLGLHRPLRLPVLVCVLLAPGEHHVRDELAVLRVHEHHLPAALPRHGHHRVFLVPVLQLPNIRQHQGGLEGMRRERRAKGSSGE
jgi:hypothetical protein